MNTPNPPLPGSQFITITLPPKAYKFKAADQYNRVKSLLKTVMTTHCEKWCLVAELTKQANVHFHGWFTERYEKATMFLLDQLKDAHLGYTQVNKERITEIHRTHQYMTKDWCITKQVLGTSPCLNSWFVEPNTKLPLTQESVIKQLNLS